MAETTSGHLKLVVTPYYSGTTAYWNIKVYSVEWAYADNQTLTWGDAVSGSVGYYASSANGVVTLLYERTVGKAGVLGGSYKLDVSVSGAYDGSSPSLANVYSTIPAQVPGKVATPTISSITNTGAKVNWTAPASNGASITKYQVQIDDYTSFVTPVFDVEDTASPATTGGLNPSDDYWARVRAYNSVGWGPWSDSRPFSTTGTAPDQVTGLTPSNILPDAFTASWSAPYNGGSAITGYDVQLADNDSFTGATTYTTTSLSRTFTGLAPKSPFFVRVRAKNAIGTGSWSATLGVSTLSSLNVKVLGEWLIALVRVKISGSWRTAKVWKKVDGVWVL